MKRSSSSLLFACALGVITARSGTDPSGKMDEILTFVKENGDVKWRQIANVVVVVAAVVVIKSQITCYLH